MTPAHCRRCRVRQVCKCVRCGKPTGRVSADVPGGKACAYCRRFFEPPRKCPRCGLESRHLSVAIRQGPQAICPRCRSEDQETCRTCRKHRPVATRTAQGKPLCVKCSTRLPFICSLCGEPGTPHTASECILCYRRRALRAEAIELAAAVPLGWARAGFERFALDAATARTVHPLCRQRLRHQVRLFVELGNEFAVANEITPEKLLARFGLEGLRRQQAAYGWLTRQGLAPVVKLEHAGPDTEERAQRRLLARVDSPWPLALLQRYQKHLLAYLARWRKRGWSAEHEKFTPRTVTLLLRAAWRFLDRLGPEHTSPQSIDRGAFDAMVSRYPGHRNALHSFVSYLNRKEHLFQKLHIDRSSDARDVPFEDLLTAEQASELSHRWSACGPEKTRNALLCLLMLTYVRTAKQACGLRRGDFVDTLEGGMDGRFGPVPVELGAGVVQLMRRHISALEAERGTPLQAEEFLFPGRLPGRSLTPAGMQYVLNSEGVTANQLYTTGLSSFFRAGLRHPKVLVRALGISDQTAVKYWHAFNPRLRDEMAALEDEVELTPFPRTPNPVPVDL